MNTEDLEFVAKDVSIKDRAVFLVLQDGSTHSFPVAYYPLLSTATDQQINEVKLRVGGRALRWESLDEDIWITDAILGRYPSVTSNSQKTA